MQSNVCLFLMHLESDWPSPLASYECTDGLLFYDHDDGLIFYSSLGFSPIFCLDRPLRVFDLAGLFFLPKIFWWALFIL